MRLPAYALLLLLAPFYSSLAADPNGYTSQYECRAGGARCSVDVAALVSRSCDQIVLPSDRDWSKITNNPSARVFCVHAGDHTAKGPLIVDFSGTSESYKVLRYYRPNDTNDEPWRQSAANRAKVDRIRFIGAAYWIVHRLVADPDYASSSHAVYIGAGRAYGLSGPNSHHIILNRVLAQHATKQVLLQGADDTVVQNSVLRESIMTKGVDTDGIGIFGGQRIFVTNNEIYGISSHGVYISDNSPSPGTVFENNDIYADSSQWTDCNGNRTPNDPDSPCALTEAAYSSKSGGSRGNPVRVIQNRMWGIKRTDINLCCISGSGGQIVSLSSGAAPDPGSHYVLIQNNIIAEGQFGILTAREGPSNNSIIGNIVYRVRNFTNDPTKVSYALTSFDHWDDSEVYFNTVVDAGSWGHIGSGNGALEVQCNAIIASGPRGGGAPDAATVVNYNAFLGTQKFTTDSGSDTNVERSLASRANSTFYAAGRLVQLGPLSACRTGRESACFLYQAVEAGVTAANAPSACTSLGCEFHDGGVTWKAVRGPYFYKRKLRTVVGGETAFIPYARVSVGAPETQACDASIGTRVGVGVDDAPLL